MNVSRTPMELAATTDLSRREFVALSVAAGLSSSALAASASVVETNVSIKTPDGICDAVFIHSATGTHPGVLLWTDAFGLRPSMRDMGKQLAAQGYSVLVPNPYYRVGKAPFWESAASVNFQDPATREKLGPLMASIATPGAIEKDAAAHIAFLDGQPQVAKAKKIGSHGYCMGGALVMKTAAALPDRIGAGASFHGGGLVTDKPDSPHLLASRIKARMYIGIASNDDLKQPDAKNTLKKAFDDAKVPAQIEVYPANHGWCVPDMPHENGAPLYSKPDAERAWNKLLSLYEVGLV